MTWSSPGPAWLFCPADRPELYPKALARADVVILDLEDAVATSRKDEARSGLADLDFDVDRTVLRVNAPGSALFEKDTNAARVAGFRRLMLPKADNAEALRGLSFDLIPLIETPLGILQVDAIAAVENVVGMFWGAEDLTTAMGGIASRRDDGEYRDVARLARTRTLVAAKSFGHFAIDAVVMEIDNLDRLARECADGYALGFDATAAIHPSQVDVIRSQYTPDPDTIAWARRVLAAVDDDGVTSFEGMMIDGPLLKQARELIARASLRQTARRL